MSMTDPVADMLTRIRNGRMAGHTKIKIPGSRMKMEIAGILRSQGFITELRCAARRSRP